MKIIKLQQTSPEWRNLRLGKITGSTIKDVVSDIEEGYFKQFLTYKSNVFLVDPKYTSQKCSSCGHTESANRINQHTFKCKECDSEFNADYNASLNIMSSGRALIRQREALACA